MRLQLRYLLLLAVCTAFSGFASADTSRLTVSPLDIDVASKVLTYLVLRSVENQPSMLQPLCPMFQVIWWVRVRATYNESIPDDIFNRI